MKLLVDIGNTATKIGLLNKELIYIGRLYNRAINLDSIKEVLKEVANFKIEEISISSVAPKVFITLSDIFYQLFKVSAKLIDVNTEVDFGIEIDNRNELGVDLLCDLVAADKLYGPKTAVIDFGTATKVLFINKDNIFSSCAIFLGYEASKKILANSTELLPDVGNIKIKNISDCHNTVDVINSSAYYSQLFTVNGIIEKFEKEVGYKMKRVYTGGNAIDFLSEIKKENYDEFLVLKGLAILAERK